MIRLLFFPLVLLFSSFLANAAGLSDEERIQKVSEHFANVLVVQAVKEKDNDKRVKMLEDVIDQSVDIDYFAASVMGKHYKKYGKKGAIRLGRILRSSMVNFYNSNLNLVKKNVSQKGFQIQYRKASFSNTKKTRATKDILIQANKTAKPIQLTLSFRKKNKENRWVASNIIIQGINYGLNVRGAFYTQMDKQNGDFEAVILSLEKSLIAIKQ